MFRSCKTSCRKCFPNGCCGFCKPPPQIQKQVDTVIKFEKNIVETATRYGYAYLYPGVRISENTYTSPLLSIHLHQHSHQKANVAQNNRTLLVQGTNNQYTSQGPQNFVSKDSITADEETIMIPIEDIVTIGSQLEFKKGIKADVESTIIPTYGFLPNCFDGCWNKTTSCCSEPNKIFPAVNKTLIIQADSNRNTEYEETELPVPPYEKGCFDSCRCCCCRKTILKKQVQKKKISKETEAQRVITLNIEYSKYSNPDTPSHTRLLSSQHQVDYYKQKFDAEKKLKFYLVNNTEYDGTSFQLKKLEAEVLARTVMQLKGMRDHYPSERELEEILNMNYKRVFGDEYIEPVLQLPIGSTANTPRAASTSQTSQAPKRPMIEQRPQPKTTTISAENPPASDEDD